MIEPSGGGCEKAVESSPDKLECNENETNNPEAIADNHPHSKFDNNSPLEQSFEVISPTLSNFNSMETNEKEPENEGQQASDFTDAKSKPRSNSGSSLQQRLKKSGSFLAKLQSSSEDNGSPNIQSSIASAFSSFASNFTLNSSTNGGDNTASSLTIETASTSTRLSQITETKEDVFNKKATMERKNLISLTKLIVKDLISTSLLARTIEDCSNVTHLNNYFTLIDRVLKHGLKQNLLSSKSAGLWNALDSLPKYLKESTLMSESVRSLANTKTPDGKIKAWMRLAMMQKKLPEYFNELLANKNVLLKDIYHDYAFVLNDEAHVFAGLIIGVNVIDCNFFVKDANFDLMDDAIDISPYLRIANSYDGDQADEPGSGPVDQENLTAILDQKNYLEEWNKRLETTIHNLQTKIKSLEEQNSKLEMEVKLSEVKIQNLQKKHGEVPSEKQTNTNSSITDAIKNFIVNTDLSSAKVSESTITASKTSKIELSDHEHPISVESTVSTSLTEQDINSTTDNSAGVERKQPSEEKVDQTTSSTSRSQPSVETELRHRLVEQENELILLKERASILEGSYRSALEKIKVLERDLDIQTSMNADKETTIKIYEKDIRDKQAQVESLRNSLSDSKKLNAELNEKIDELNNKMKERIKSVSILQDTLSKWKLENKTLATRLLDKQTALKSTSAELDKCLKTMEDLKKNNEKINEDLKEEQNSRILELSEKLSRLEPFKDRTEELTKRCRDYEQSLEEIGVQLRESRLEVENLKENSAVFLDSQWMDSKPVKTCALCLQLFSVTRRKHHCRLCGNVFCQTCSDNKMELASSSKPVRVCDTCHSFLLAKFVKSST